MNYNRGVGQVYVPTNVESKSTPLVSDVLRVTGNVCLGYQQNRLNISNLKNHKRLNWGFKSMLSHNVL